MSSNGVERDVTEQILTDAVIAMSLRDSDSTTNSRAECSTPVQSIAPGIPRYDFSRRHVLEARLRRFYRVYNPDQIERVSDIAFKYKDRVNELMHALVRKYGPEPIFSRQNGNSTTFDDTPPPVRYVVPERIRDASVAYAIHLQEKERREPAQIKEDENLARAIAMVQEDFVVAATVVPKKKRRRRSSLFRRLFTRLKAPLTRRRREKFMKKIETSLAEGSRPPPPPVRFVVFVSLYMYCV